MSLSCFGTGVITLIKWVVKCSLFNLGASVCLEFVITLCLNVW